jgi:spermidine synthase
VLTIAERDFTYLEYCTGASVVIADARLGLEALSTEGAEFDLLILDVYADDMIPIHLMTAEAVELYRSLLAPRGLLAIHISSRYLELRPVIAAVADANDMEARYVYDFDPTPYTVSSMWTLLAIEDIFAHEAFTETSTFADIKPRLWTDTYSTVLPLIKWNWP